MSTLSISEPEESGPSADEGIVAQLMDMGFPRVRCQKAALNTSNTGVEEAMNWLLSHMDDPGMVSILFSCIFGEFPLVFSCVLPCYIFS